MSFQISQRLMEWNLGVKNSSTKFWWIFIINFRWWFRAKPYRFCDLFGKKIKKMMVDTCFEDGRNHQNKKTVMIVHWIYWIAFVNGPMILTWKILIRIYQRRMNVKPSEGINIPSREVKQGPGTREVLQKSLRFSHRKKQVWTEVLYFGAGKPLVKRSPFETGRPGISTNTWSWGVGSQN